VGIRANQRRLDPAGREIGDDDAVGPANQGSSVALPASGGTAIVGGWSDRMLGNIPGTGAFWVYARIADVWAQQGGKLVGTGAVNSTVGARLG
jgi:hypothetical protein